MLLLPDLRARGVAAIPPEALADRDVLLFDLDNTLTHPETVTVPPGVRDWLNAVCRGRTCLCISNSPTARRRKDTMERALGIPLLTDVRGRKPFGALLRVLEARYHLRGQRVAVIGDRLFTDVLFGKRLGARTILVHPLSPRESLAIRLVRLVENLLLYLLGA